MSMSSQSLAMIVLIAGIGLGPVTPASRAVDPTPNPIKLTSAVGVQRSLAAASLPRSLSVSDFVPWQNRRKAVLEETDPRIVDEIDLGPAPLDQPSIPSTHSRPMTRLFVTTRSLRC
jgi:hypothetical protein